MGARDERCRVCCAAPGEPCDISPQLSARGFVHAGRGWDSLHELCSWELGGDPVSGCEHPVFGRGYDLCAHHLHAYRQLTGCPVAGIPGHSCERETADA